MSMEIQRLSPLWETFPNHEVQPAEKGDGGAIFADVFRAAIDNVRQAEDEKVKKINLAMLELFYRKPYEKERGFYEEFEERMRRFQG